MGSRLLYLVRHGEQDRPSTGSPEAESPEVGLSGRGRRQAMLLGERLRGVPFAAVHHGPLRRAVETAELVGAALPGVPLHASELAGDYLPSVPEPAGLPPAYAAFLDGFSEQERTDGPRLAAAAIDRLATVPVDGDRRDLIITHTFLIGWFVRHAMDAPDRRWIGLNHHNCGLTAILYRPDRPPTLVAYNDVGHLPSELRDTGLPPEFQM